MRLRSASAWEFWRYVFLSLIHISPDGSDLDVNEIYSSTVIAQAMDSLGASGRLTTVRSNCSVTPIISEEQEKINDALIEKGEEVTYFPDTYKAVSYTHLDVYKRQL